MAAAKVNAVLFAFFSFFIFSGLMQLSAAAAAQDVATAGGGAARVIDAKAVDQAVAYLLMLVALFVTYFAH